MIPWSDATRRRFGYLLVGVTAGFVITAVWMSLAEGNTGTAVQTLVLGVALSLVNALSVRAVPRNAAIWALIWAALFGSAGEAAKAVALSRTGYRYSALEDGLVTVSPSTLDPVSAIAINVALWAWVPAVFILSIHLLIMFPSGRASSTAWRRVAWISALSIAAMVLASAWNLAPWVETPYSDIMDGFGAAGYLAPLILGLMLASAASLVHLALRYRASSGEERLQYRWVTWALGLYVLSILGFAPLELLGIGEWAGTLVLANIPVSFGIAITKYRLFDIDIVISRTLLFIGLVGFITLVYAGVVVGIGSLVGGSSLGWSIAATALVAVAFEPVRARLQRWINRIVYRRRATPYEVLSDLTGRLAVAESEEGLLDRMALRLADGTGAERTVVWIRDESGFRAAACQPSSVWPTGPEPHLEAIPGSVVQIEHGDEVLGALSVETHRGNALTPTETRLVEDLAGSAGMVMRRLRLDASLAQKALELEESRRRLVDAQDVERRRLERELDEHVQHQVVALKGELELAERLARNEGSETTAMLVEQMSAETRDAIDQIRAVAYGIYPPGLEAEGLSAAIQAMAELAPLDVEIEAAMTKRHPLPVEAAVYFTVSESLTNAAKHGVGPITIELSDSNNELMFAVSDSGPGFDPQTVQRGAGLNNMGDRLDALGGGLTVVSEPGGRTTIAGWVPVSVSAAV